MRINLKKIIVELPQLLPGIAKIIHPSIISALYGRLKENGIKDVISAVHKLVYNAKRDRQYTRWVYLYDRITLDVAEKFESRIRELGYRPRISVIMSVYKPNLLFLEKAIRSVRSQYYSNWELCICDDASCDDDLSKLLSRHAQEDERIKVITNTEHLHISGTLNSAIDISDGEYLAFLYQDDMLSRHALYWVAEELNRNHDAKFLYSDEDRINEQDERFMPHFKPDWNPDLLNSYNMVCHLTVISMDLISKVGGFRSGFEGAEDYDLVLRCAEIIDHSEIVHIPRILYHIRRKGGRSPHDIDVKLSVRDTGRRALYEHVEKFAEGVEVKCIDNIYRVIYPLPDPEPRVSIIIPTKNKPDLLRMCVDSIHEKTLYKNYEILIVDNGSTDKEALEYIASLAERENVDVITIKGKFNYSRLNNVAAGHASGDVLGLVNNDIEIISPDWMGEMVRHVIRPEIGVVGAKLFYPNSFIQHAGVILGLRGVAGHAFKGYRNGMASYFRRADVVQNYSAVTAACMFVQKEVYQKIGGLDEDNLAVAYNDIDFCLRASEKGYRILWTPYATMYHYESRTRGQDNTAAKKAQYEREYNYMRERWKHVLERDPAYNPNLTLDYDDFSLAFPPRINHVLH